MVLQQGSPAYAYDAASYAYASCKNLVLPWSSVPIHIGASSIVFRDLTSGSATAADVVVDSEWLGLGKYWDFTLWGCDYSDWGAAVRNNQPRLVKQLPRGLHACRYAPSSHFDSDMFSGSTPLLDFEVKALKRVRTRWGACACAVTHNASAPALLLGGNSKIGLFG